MKTRNFGRERINIFAPFYRLYKTIRDDEEKKKKSVVFGLISILFSVICVAVVYPGVYFGVKGIIFAFTHNLGIFTYIFGLGNIFIFALGLMGFVLPYYLWFQGILLVIFQFLLNRRFISWFALIVWLASVVGMLWLTSISLDLIVNPMLDQDAGEIVHMLIMRF